MSQATTEQTTILHRTITLPRIHFETRPLLVIGQQTSRRGQNAVCGSLLDFADPCQHDVGSLSILPLFSPPAGDCIIYVKAFRMHNRELRI